jgi:TonB family protein
VSDSIITDWRAAQMTSASAYFVSIAAVVCLGPGELTAQAPRLKVGGEVKRPALIHHVAPVYPKEAVENRIVGTVRVDIVIATDGAVLEVKVAERVHPLLDEAAAKAVSQWKYVPTKVNGEPVELTMTVDVPFALLPASATAATLAQASDPQTGDQMDPRIPAPITAKYKDIRGGKDWRNPIVTIRAEGVEVVSRGLPTGRRTVPVADLRALVIALPVADWPYGRVVLAQDIGLRYVDGSDDQPIKQNHDAADRILKALGITVDWSPSALESGATRPSLSLQTTVTPLSRP